MKTTGYLIVNSRGLMRVIKGRAGLNWDEVQVKLSLDIPDEFFRKPILEATIEVDKNIIPKPQPMDLIINTKEQIEELTGATINFKVIPMDEDGN